jgi:hypothetical protein
LMVAAEVSRYSAAFLFSLAETGQFNLDVG